MRVLGISAFHRDSAAALVVDGVPVAAAQEERYTRKRVDSAFPRRAARYCLDRAGITAGDLDAVVFHEKPLRKFERTLTTQLRSFPRSSRTFARAMFLWLGDRLWLRSKIASELSIDPGMIAFVEHQRAHAASAFFAAPFDDAAILTLDDMGEWATASIARGRGKEISIECETMFPHSLGLWYSAFVQFLGMEPGIDEEKLEALGHCGEPRFEREVGATLAALDDGGFAVDLSRFRFEFDGERLFDPSLATALGPPRMSGAPFRMAGGSGGGTDSRDADLAASVQRVLEERVLALARTAKSKVGGDALCVAGEVARNRTLLARLVADGPFSRVFVPPAPGECGSALGAALDWCHSIAGAERAFRQDHARFGESIEDLAEEGARALGGPDAARAALVERLVAGKLVGWARGAMDFGSTSLGDRVILGAAGGDDARERLLGSVQQDEGFVPCRIAVPAERAREFFDVRDGAEHALRFAQLTVRANDAARVAAKSAILRDGAAWVQTVDAKIDPDFHRVLVECGARGGAPLLLVSTLQSRGVPMARNEADCVEVFRRSTLDALVVANRIYERAAGARAAR